MESAYNGNGFLEENVDVSSLDEIRNKKGRKTMKLISYNKSRKNKCVDKDTYKEWNMNQISNKVAKAKWFCNC